MSARETLEAVLDFFSRQQTYGVPFPTVVELLDPTRRHRYDPIEIPNVGRDDLARLFAVLNARAGAEIGVEEGLYAEVLCRHNPRAAIYAIDPWKAYEGYSEHTDDRRLQWFYEATRERLKDFDNAFVVRETSLSAATKVRDLYFDFVYIDANHTFEYFTADLAAWIPRVKSGGIIAGHDYMERTDKSNDRRFQVHVVEVLSGYTRAYGISPWFVLGRKDIRPGEVRDRPRSWMWVKP